MEQEIKGKKEGLSRRGFLKAAGVVGAVAVAQKAMAQMPTLVAGNPWSGDRHAWLRPGHHFRTVHDIELAQGREMGCAGGHQV
jgi:hypothetical protein